MRRQSAKRRARFAEVLNARDAYRYEFPRCQWCRSAPATDLHEIARGPARGKALGERCAWLHLCRECHEICGSLPVAGQLAIKFLADERHYDRRRVNELRGRAAEAITVFEVQRWLERLKMGWE